MADESLYPSQSSLPSYDRMYFLSIFGSKISELESEMQRLQHQKESLVEDNQEYIALSKTTEDLRNELEDYNMARMNSFCDVTELQKEIDDLHAHNQQLESMIDEYHQKKQRKEKRIKQLECNFSNANNVRETDEASILEDQLNKMREQTSDSMIQQEALSLIDQISELESKYDQLIDEEQTLELTTHMEQCLHEIQKNNLELLSFISRSLINSTLAMPAEQHCKLKQDFIKLEHLDQKLTNEIRELKIQSIKMQEDIAKFSDLETLKHRAERRKHQLTADKINMSKRKQITQMEIQTLQSQFEALQRQLEDNQTHQQLVHLEQKLQTLSSLDETPPDYEPIKHQALALVRAHNQWLIHRLKPPS